MCSRGYVLRDLKVVGVLEVTFLGGGVCIMYTQKGSQWNNVSRLRSTIERTCLLSEGMYLCKLP